MVYRSNYLRKHWQTILFFRKKHGKHNDHTMIIIWIMENMVIIPWSCHESWRPWQETCLPCRQHGIIMAMFRHDHGKIMAWQPCFSNPGRAENTFLRKITILYAFYSKFATLSDFWKIQDFFRKTHLLLKKNPNCERFEKFYYFSRILRQICYNLLKKMTFTHVNNRCWLVYASSIDKHRVKNAPIWEEDFAFHILNMTQNKNLPVKGCRKTDVDSECLSNLINWKLQLTNVKWFWKWNTGKSNMKPNVSHLVLTTSCNQ